MRDEVVDGLAELIAAVESGLPRGEVREVVDRIVSKEAMGRRLLAQVTADPEMFTSGSSRMPLLLDRILLDLAAAGGVVVRPPGCASCGRVVLLNCRDGEDRVCAACGRLRKDSQLIDCLECGRRQKRHAEVAGDAFCRSCWMALQTVADERLDRFVMACVPAGTMPMMLSATEGLKADRLLRLALESERFGAAWIADPAAASALFAAFYDALRELGAALPARACGHCGRVTKLSGRLDGRICCRACYKAGHRGVCDGCDKTANIESRLADGRRLCQACTNELPESWADCIVCGNRRMIAVRAPEGPMCSRCRSAPAPDVCTVCGVDAECRFPSTSNAICLSCYAAARVDVCHRCGQEGECRFAGSPKALCEPCAQRPKECSGCGRMRLPARHTEDGSPLCWSCAPQVVETCSSCGRDKQVNARTAAGPICQSCARTSPLMFRDCVRCGAHGRLHHRRWCDRCYADDKLHELLPDELVAADPRAATLRERFLAGAPRRTLLAFRRNTTVRALRDALNAPEPLSHALLDDIAPEGTTAPVRALLVEHGLLPPRDETLIKFERWCQHQSARLADPEHRRAFDRFVRWRHLRQLRAQPGPARPSQSQGRRQELRHVIDLLSWLTGRSESLTQLDQARLDLWLLEGPRARRRVAAFLDWFARDGDLPRLQVRPLPRTTNTPTGTSTEERWELLSSLLAAADTDPRTRLAGALLLLFGIPVSRLHQLQVTDIDERAPVTIRLGPDPLELPDEIGELALAARAHRDAPRLLTDAGEVDWLFPGQRHGSPLSRDALTDRLAVFGIRPRHARAGALAALAQELPAPVIARLTGLHVTAATRWADAAAASNARYSALSTRTW